MTRTRPVLFAVALGLAASTAAADDLTTSNGKKITGKVVAVDAQGVTFTTTEAQVKVPAKEIVVVDLGNKVAPVPKDKDTGKDAKFSEIELTDGSTFRAAKFVVKGKKFETELFPGPAGVAAPRFELPITAVFSAMRDAGDAKQREAWKKMLATRGKRDLYVIREETGLNFVQGTVLSGTDDGAELNFEKEDGTPTKLRLSRATGGLVFSQPQPSQVAQTVCKVVDVFGNSLVAQAVEVTPSGVTVKTVSGVVVAYPSLAGLARFDYAQGNVAYLSDLEPQVDAPESPPDEKGLRLNVAAPFIRDRGVAGEPLKLPGYQLPFPKGLVVAPDTVLTYNLGGDYREFRVVVGIPETSPDAALEAKVTIEADGRVLFSEPVKRKDKPKELSLDVKGAKQLRIIVDADLAVNGNRVVLADARVQK
jgi:NPCBM/NEW2 domain